MDEIYVKLLKPQFPKTYGQGDPPTGMTININSETFFLRYGEIFLVAECASPVGVMEANPPVINPDFYEEHKVQFEEVDYE